MEYRPVPLRRAKFESCFARRADICSPRFGDEKTRAKHQVRRSAKSRLAHTRCESRETLWRCAFALAQSQKNKFGVVVASAVDFAKVLGRGELRFGCFLDDNQSVLCEPAAGVR